MVHWNLRGPRRTPVPDIFRWRIVDSFGLRLFDHLGKGLLSQLDRRVAESQILDVLAKYKTCHGWQTKPYR
jgi:hypothetical protein